MQELIKVENLSKTFKLSAKQQKIEKTNEKVRRAVDGLSFSAYEGEIFGLLGPNGAGKTTTLRLLATLIKPDSGDALVDGCSIVKDPERVRSKIGFLTSELKLEEFFTPNYLFDFFSDLHTVDPAVRDRRKKELFEKFGIDRFALVGPSVGGMLSLAFANLYPERIRSVIIIGANYKPAIEHKLSSFEQFCAIEMDEKYPEYQFCKHKGYGTKLHYEMIEKYGVSEIHRRTFLKNIRVSETEPNKV